MGRGENRETEEDVDTTFRADRGRNFWLKPGKGNDEWSAQLASGGRAVKESVPVTVCGKWWLLEEKRIQAES